MLSLSKDASETHPLTIIPANGKPIINGIAKNGKEKNGKQHNNNGSAIPNGKELKITTVENGKDNGLYNGEKYDEFDDDEDMKFGWGSFRPQWLQWMATKQMFLFVFCAIWVSFHFCWIRYFPKLNKDLKSEFLNLEFLMCSLLN